VPLIAVPNVSTGSNKQANRLADVLRGSSAVVLDVHSDVVHGRSVFTLTAPADALVEATVALADQAARNLDLTAQRGVHPRMGVLDVCPFVPHGETTIAEAVSAARTAGERIASASGIPVYLYGEAALRPGTRHLPDLRRGGLAGLRSRAQAGLEPDFGGPIDERWGVVCVGARGVLIAFNVWIKAVLEVARTIASRVRESGGGLPGVRSLGLEIETGICQVSMNLITPDETGIEAAFLAVEANAHALGATVLATEIVGIPPERYWPASDARATRLLREPGRTLEAALREAGI